MLSPRLDLSFLILPLIRESLMTSLRFLIFSHSSFPGFNPFNINFPKNSKTCGIQGHKLYMAVWYPERRRGGRTAPLKARIAIEGQETPFSPCSLIVRTGYEGHGMGPWVRLSKPCGKGSRPCYRVNRFPVSSVSTSGYQNGETIWQQLPTIQVYQYPK